MTFTARALFFRCRSFDLHRLAVRGETFAQLVPEGITARIRNYPGFAKDLIIGLMCVAVNPEIGLILINNFDHISGRVCWFNLPHPMTV